MNAHISEEKNYLRSPLKRQTIKAKRSVVVVVVVLNWQPSEVWLC